MLSLSPDHPIQTPPFCFRIGFIAVASPPELGVDRHPSVSRVSVTGRRFETTSRRACCSGMLTSRGASAVWCSRLLCLYFFEPRTHPPHLDQATCWPLRRRSCTAFGDEDDSLHVSKSGRHVLDSSGTGGTRAAGHRPPATAELYFAARRGPVGGRAGNRMGTMGHAY